MKNKATELVAATTTDLTTYTESDLQEWGGNELSSKDIIIPSLILLQSNSEFVKLGKGKGGDFFDTMTEQNFGPEIKNVVPFHMEKTWTVEKFNGKKWEWDHTEKMTPENENSPYEFEVGADKFRNKYTYRFYVLVEGNVLPFSLKLKGASKKAGSNLSTEMYVKNSMMRLPPAAKMISLSSFLDKNDEGDTYFVVKVAVTEKTPYERVIEALNWFKTLRDDKRTVVVDESGEKDF